MYMRYANRLCCITTTLTMCTIEQLHLTQSSFLQFLKIVFINTTIQFATFECTSLRTTIYRQYLSESIYYCIFDSFSSSCWSSAHNEKIMFILTHILWFLMHGVYWWNKYFSSKIFYQHYQSIIKRNSNISTIRKWMSSSINIQMKCEKNVSPGGFHI